MKLSHAGMTQLLILKEPDYESLVSEIAELTGVDAAAIVDQRRYRLYFRDEIDDEISIANEKSFHAALLLWGHADAQQLQKSGIKVSA